MAEGDVKKGEKFEIPRKFKKMFVDGITTPMSYLVMKRWDGRGENKGYHAAIQPHLIRIDEDTVFVGGKLRIAFDSADEDKSIKPLLNKFGHIAWARISWQRASVMHGQMLKAGVVQGAEFFSANHGTAIINELEKLLHTKFDDKMNVVQAFTSTLKIQSKNVFKDDIEETPEVATELEAASEIGVAQDSNVHNLFGNKE